MIFRLLISSIAGVVLATTASAADRADIKTRNSTIVMRDFGKCIVNKSRQKARQLLSFMPYSLDERKTLVEMPLMSCLDQEENIKKLEFDYRIVRGVVAEHLFVTEFGSVDGVRKRKSEIPGIFSIVGATERSESPDQTRLSIMMLRFASCVVDKSPAEAVRVLQVPAGSVEEKVAIANLAPAMGMCAADGVSFKIVRPQLRGFIAEAAYRAAVVAMPGQS